MSTRFGRPYKNYKPTKVPGIPSVPEDWNVLRLRFLVREPLQYGANEAAELEDPDCPRFVRITDVDESGQLRPETFRSLPEDVARPFLLQNGDLLLARSGATVGKTFLYNSSWGRCAYAGYLIRARLAPRKALASFVFYFTQSIPYKQWVAANFIQATIQNVSADKYASLSVPVPSLAIQQHIAAFLDRETARIDRLIFEKTQLVERLAERRAAIITHAVTQGLDAAATLKLSGVDWLPSVPKHWTVRAFRYSARIVNGQVDPEQPQYRDLQLIAPNHIESGTGRLIGTESAAEQSAESGKYLFEAGMVLYSKIRPALAKVCIAPVRGLCSADMYPITPRNDLLSDFLMYYMVSEPFTNAVVLLSSRVAMPKINRRDLGGFAVLVPPLTEQRAIVARIRDVHRRIDAAAAATYDALERLREYRSALITNAVTGRIDVRSSATKCDSAELRV
jgi:type I restriction enzyme S subunit